MEYSPNIQVAVYQILDQLIAANVPPPGAKATIHSIIDDLRAAVAPAAMIAHTEAISIQLHQLESAVVLCDEERGSKARGELQQIAAAWLNERIRH